MRTDHFTITSRQVHQLATDRLQAALRLPDYGRKCSAAVVLGVLFWAAALSRSLAAACTALVAAPSDQALRNALRATLPAAAELQRRLNRALAGGLPRALQRRRHYVALDLTLLPYYGRPHSDAAELYRGPSKAGTKHSHAYYCFVSLLNFCIIQR
jgi:putative transposase